MTFDERVPAVAKKGFTERQARFLTMVMLHAGVCVAHSTHRDQSVHTIVITGTTAS
jgi:hypothetical protein